MKKTLVVVATLAALVPAWASADMLGQEKSLQVIGHGSVISSMAGAGSSNRGDKQAVYVMYEGVLHFCNLFTQKKRSTSEAQVEVECFSSSEGAE